MTRPGSAPPVPLGVRVHVGALPAGVAALAVAAAVDVPAYAGGTTITVSDALSARGRGYALQRALHALAAAHPAGLPWAGVVAMRGEWRAAEVSDA